MLRCPDCQKYLIETSHASQVEGETRYYTVFQCPVCSQKWEICSMTDDPMDAVRRSALGLMAFMRAPAEVAQLTEADIRRIIREELRAWQDEQTANAHRRTRRGGMNGGLHSF